MQQEKVTKYKLFISSHLDFEKILHDEVYEILTRGETVSKEDFVKKYHVTDDEGGIELLVTPLELWQLVHRSRVAETMRIRIGDTYRAYNFDQLKDNIKKLPWSAYLDPKLIPETKIKVACSKSKLIHSGAVEERVREAIQERLAGYKPKQEKNMNRTQNPTVYIRLVNDYFQASIDVSGELLHKRGYRTFISEAPIRETVAAGLIRLVGAHKIPLTGDSEAVRLWDCFCGSGTFPLEAACMALNKPSSDVEEGRRYAFMDWTLHQSEQYQSFLANLRRETATTDISTLSNIRFYGSDIDEKAVYSSKENGKRAGFSESQVNKMFFTADFKKAEKTMQFDDKSVIISNLPYGKRVGDNVDKLVKDFGDMIRRKEIKHVYVVTGSKNFEQLTKLSWESMLSFKNGPIPVRFLKLLV